MTSNTTPPQPRTRKIVTTSQVADHIAIMVSFLVGYATYAASDSIFWSILATMLVMVLYSWVRRIFRRQRRMKLRG